MIIPTAALCVQLSGPRSAHVLYRLFWWVEHYPEKTKDGFKWNANPSSWWAQQTGLSTTQVDRAIAKLQKLKLIVIEHRPRGNLLRVRWLRLTTECEQVILTNAKGQSGGTAQIIPFAHGGNVPADAAAPSKDSSKGKLKAPISDLPVGDVGTPSQESAESTNILNTATFNTFWKTEVEAATGNWVADFNKPEHKFAGDLIHKTAGQDLVGALKAAINDWGSFRHFVAGSKGIDEDDIADKPQVFTVMQHPTELIGFAKKKAEEIKKAAVSKAKQDAWFKKAGT